jgi:diamine N-acetyltransferase
MLENNYIKLRAAEPQDLELLYKWENDTTLWTFGNTISPYSKYVLREFLKNADKDIFTTKQLRLMIDTTSRHYGWSESVVELLDPQSSITIGCVDLYDFDVFHQRIAVGILIDKQYRNKGLAAEALSLTIDYCFSFLKLKQIYCYIPAGNETSIKLFEKAGFTENGILKDWIKTADGFCDVSVFQLINH